MIVIKLVLYLSYVLVVVCSLVFEGCFSISVSILKADWLRCKSVKYCIQSSLFITPLEHNNDEIHKSKSEILFDAYAGGLSHVTRKLIRYH